MTHAWTRHRIATGTVSTGLTATSTSAAARKGTTCATVVAVHQRPSVRSRRASMRARQWTPATSGRTSPANGLAAADGQAHDHEVGVERQLAHLVGVPGARRDHPEVAALELGAEGLDRALDRLGVVGAPLRERRVAGLIHPDELRHACLLGAGS